MVRCSFCVFLILLLLYHQKLFEPIVECMPHLWICKIPHGFAISSENKTICVLMAEPYKVYQRNLNIPDAKENFFVMQKLAFRNFTNGLLANASRIQDLCRKEIHKSVVKVSWFRNEFLKFSFAPRIEQKYFCISAF